jgi:hypothetical protein
MATLIYGDQKFAIAESDVETLTARLSEVVTNGGGLVRVTLPNGFVDLVVPCGSPVWIDRRGPRPGLASAIATATHTGPAATDAH